MKFPTNPNPSAYVNPGVKSDRGRLILILIATAIAYFVFSSWGGAQELWNQIVTDIENEIGFDLDGNDNTPDETMDLTPYKESEIIPDPQPVPRQPEPTYDFNSTSTTTIETDLPEDMGRQIFLDSREQIIQQLREQGQEDQIPMVLEMLDEMEQSYN